MCVWTLGDGQETPPDLFDAYLRLFIRENVSRLVSSSDSAGNDDDQQAAGFQGLSELVFNTRLANKHVKGRK